MAFGRSLLRRCSAASLWRAAAGFSARHFLGSHRSSGSWSSVSFSSNRWSAASPVAARSGWLAARRRAPCSPPGAIRGCARSRAAAQTAAAFANGQGGDIVFGIDPDEVTFVGLESAGSDTDLRDQLAQMVRARVVPTPPFTVRSYELDGRKALVLRVDAGPTPPDGIVVDKNSADKPEFYVRRGASTDHAQPSDLREPVLARVATRRQDDRIPPWAR